MVNESDLTFAEWLQAEMDRRGWSQADLADRAGNISRAAISLVMGEARKPGPEVCRGIAKAFDMPEEFVFRRAGLLSPSETGRNEYIDQILHLAAQLDTPEQALIVDQLRMLLGRQARRNVIEEFKQRTIDMPDDERAELYRQLLIELGIVEPPKKRRGS